MKFVQNYGAVVKAPDFNISKAEVSIDQIEEPLLQTNLL